MIKQEKIVEELAAKYDLPKYVIEDIVRSQFNFVIQTMQEGEHRGIRLHHLGLFMVKPRRVEHLEKRFEEARKRKAENNGESDNK